MMSDSQHPNHQSMNFMPKRASLFVYLFFCTYFWLLGMKCGEASFHYFRDKTVKKTKGSCETDVGTIQPLTHRMYMPHCEVYFCRSTNTSDGILIKISCDDYLKTKLPEDFTEKRRVYETLCRHCKPRAGKFEPKPDSHFMSINSKNADKADAKRE